MLRDNYLRRVRLGVPEPSLGMDAKGATIISFTYSGQNSLVLSTVFLQGVRELKIEADI